MRSKKQNETHNHIFETNDIKQISDRSTEIFSYDSPLLNSENMCDICAIIQQDFMKIQNFYNIDNDKNDLI